MSGYGCKSKRTPTTEVVQYITKASQFATCKEHSRMKYSGIMLINSICNNTMDVIMLEFISRNCEKSLVKHAFNIKQN